MNLVKTKHNDENCPRSLNSAKVQNLIHEMQLCIFEFFLLENVIPTTVAETFHTDHPLQILQHFKEDCLEPT